MSFFQNLSETNPGLYIGSIIGIFFLSILGLFILVRLIRIIINEIDLDNTKTFMTCIITFLKNEKYIRSIRLKNILSENSIDYTDEFIIWYKKFSQENQFINRPIY